VPEIGDPPGLVVAEEVHVRHLDGRALDRQAGHGADAQRRLVRAGHRRPARDDVALAQHLVQLEAQVGERVAQRADDLLEVRGHVGARGLLVIDRPRGQRRVDVVEVALAEHAREALPRPALELVGSHGDHLVRRPFH
jgi:hypothetical protein